MRALQWPLLLADAITLPHAVRSSRLSALVSGLKKHQRAKRQAP
jgi:hypothetical protein